jgi:hypothetical protein
VKAIRYIDWRKPNVLIAWEIGVTGARVGQIRKEANNPQALFKAVSVAQARQYWIVVEHANEIRGRHISQLGEDLQKVLGGPHARIRRFARRHAGLVSHLHPWTEMNFQLPDRVLEAVWDVSNRVVRQYRIRHRKRLPKWGRRRERRDLEGLPSFDAALDRERARAAEWSKFKKPTALRTP